MLRTKYNGFFYFNWDMEKNPKMSDVARLAGVSSMTVSRVLSNNANVRPKTRERVLKAVKALDYYPSASARALSRQVTGNLGLMVGHKPRFDEFFNYVVRAIEEESYRHEYSLIISMQALKPGTLPMMVRQRKVDGIIAGGPEISLETLLAIENKAIPIVLIANCFESHPFHHGVADDYTGAYTAVEHLIQLGHQQIAFVGGNLKNYCIAKRFNGYRETLQKANLQFDQRVIFEGDYSREAGKIHAGEILALRPRPTAAFCSGALLAMGLMQGLQENGLTIPRDFAIVGFDDINSASLCRPPLTTVAIDKKAIGQLAAQKLFQLIKSPSLKPAKIVVSTNLVIRGSCGGSVSG